VTQRNRSPSNSARLTGADRSTTQGRRGESAEQLLHERPLAGGERIRLVSERPGERLERGIELALLDRRGDAFGDRREHALPHPHRQAEVTLQTAAPGTVQQAARVPACAKRTLVVWLDTNGDASAGHVYYELELTNLSGHAWVLRGYPGVSAVDLAGRRLGMPAARNARTAVRPVLLAPGHSASAALQVADTGVFPPTTCHSTTAAGLRVYPPNQTASKVVPYPFRACSRPAPTYLQVGTVTTATRP
jgi:Domain of unknown function (DUF4232)